MKSRETNFLSRGNSICKVGELIFRVTTLAIWLKITRNQQHHWKQNRNTSKCHCAWELVSVSDGHNYAVKQTTANSQQEFTSHSFFCRLSGAILLEALGLQLPGVTLLHVSLLFLGPVTNYGMFSWRRLENKRASLITQARLRHLVELGPFTSHWPNKTTWPIQQSKGGEVHYSPHQGKVTWPLQTAMRQRGRESILIEQQSNLP